MKHLVNLSVYALDEDRRTAGIVLRIILAVMLGYLIVTGTAIVSFDWVLTGIAIGSLLVLLVPLALIPRGWLNASSIILVSILVVSVGVIATIGQGVHDTSMMAFPVIIIFSGLILPRKLFILASLMILTALAWLVYGETLGFFIPRPAPPTGTLDFIVLAIIWALGYLTMDGLAENMRKTMRQARQEIIQRQSVEQQLRHQSTHDSLTGIYNRAYFEDQLLRLHSSQEYPISVIVVDIDELKPVNDTQGHSAGDQLIVDAVQILRSVFRSGDVLARIGGDEFVVLLPHTSQAQVIEMIERVRARLTEHNSTHPETIVKLSIGMATAEEGKLTESFITADHNMYAEKALHKSSRG